MNVFYFAHPRYPFEGKRTLERKSGDLAYRTLCRRRDVHRDETLPADFGLKRMITTEKE